MTTSHWHRSQVQKFHDVSSDVVIVGGGYAGLSTAFWLTELRPDLKIILLERNFCGAGASGRNAGFLTMGSASFYKALTLKWGAVKAKSIHQFAQESIDLVYQHVLKSSPEVEFDQTTSLTLFQSGPQFKDWSDVTFNPAFFNFSWKKNSELPQGLQGKFYGAYENGPEFRVNPVLLLSALKKNLQSRGVQIIENSSAFELTSMGVKTELSFIHSHQVVLALNGYFPQFSPLFKDVITPRRAQMLAVELEENLECPGLYYDPPERVYWRMARDNLLLIGGKRLLDEEGEVGDFEKVSSTIQQGLEDYLTHQLKVKYKIIHRWSGTMGFTEHELPLLQKIKAPIETFVMGGFSGHGMGLGFRAGKEMAQLICGHISASFFEQFKRSNIVL
jgi:gamma-glutamylputrescine oxidase